MFISTFFDMFISKGMLTFLNMVSFPCTVTLCINCTHCIIFGRQTSDCEPDRDCSCPFVLRLRLRFFLKFRLISQGSQEEDAVLNLSNSKIIPNLRLKLLFCQTTYRPIACGTLAGIQLRVVHQKFHRSLQQKSIWNLTGTGNRTLKGNKIVRIKKKCINAMNENRCFYTEFFILKRTWEHILKSLRCTTVAMLTIGFNGKC